MYMPCNPKNNFFPDLEARNEREMKKRVNERGKNVYLYCSDAFVLPVCVRVVYLRRVNRCRALC